MKKRINILFVIICILLFSNISCYAAPDPEGDPVIEPDPVPDFDITPPTGRMQVAEATKAGSNINASIRIEAEDDVSSGNEIQFYISTSPISNQEIIPDENWENYYTGVTKNVTLPNTGGTVYMLLRDKAGNISMVFSGGNAEYTISYNTNGGNSMEISGTARAIFGCPFIVTSRVPKKSGSNFLGWSTNSNATVPSYAPDDVIPASIFKGVNHNITLYAIWESTIVLIDENTDYVGYYADVDGNGSVDGIIFADLAQPVSGGQWGDNGRNYSYTKPTGTLKKYKVINVPYTGPFGTNGVISLVEGSTGKDRFYVMALSDLSTSKTWYSRGEGSLPSSNSVSIAADDFGQGKAHTAEVKMWCDNRLYGGTSTTDIPWQTLPAGWFVPSKQEWAAFGGNLGIEGSNYSGKGLSATCWSSSQYLTNYAHLVKFANGDIVFGAVYGNYAVRLATTF